MSSILPIHSILQHLPPAVRDLVCEEEYQILSEKPDPSYGHSNLITIYPSPDKKEAIVRIFHKSGKINDYTFQNQKCTLDTYRIYTKGHGPLSVEKINEIYLACMKKSIANRNEGINQILLGSIINQLLLTETLSPSEIDMPLVEKSVWPNGLEDEQFSLCANG